MEIHAIAENGIALKFTRGIVAINPPEKGGKTLTPAVILNTYAVPVPGWSVLFKEKEGQKVFLGGGEYEKDGIYIHGFSSETTSGKKTLQTTTWHVQNDDIRILILGDIAEKKDLQQVLTEVSDIDILVIFCPETKEKRLSPDAVVSMTASLQTRRMILIGANKDLKKKIRKEVGNSEEATGKYTIKKKDLLETTTKVILLEK